MGALKFGISTCGAFANGTADWQTFAKVGADYVEISEKLPWLEQADWALEAQKARQAGVTLWSVHLPFMPFERFDFSVLGEQSRQNAVSEMKRLIRKIAASGVGVAIVHPSGEPISEDMRALRMVATQKSLAELAEYAANYGITIAVEDLPRTCLGRTSSDILQLISADERLRVCFDTNHLLTEDNVHFVQQIQKKIVTTHVSDYDFINERHLLPGEGKVAWAALVDALEKTGYNGPLMYEVDLHGNYWIQRDETLCYTDFKRNFDTLVRRETPWIPTDGRKATIKE